MKVTLICLFFFTEMHNGERFVQGRTYTQMEGKNITVSCSFTFSGRTMYFCKTDCSRENILVETTDYRAQSGRYIIEFNRTGFASHVVYVSITELKTSDSGWYRCTLGRIRIQHDDFKIVVVSATSTGSPSFSSSPPFSSETTKPSSTSAPPSGVLLSVGVALTIIIIVLAAALLVFFKYRKNKQHKAGSAEPSVGTEYVTVIKPHRETETQNTVESDNLNYSEVHFPKHTTNLHGSAPCCNHGDSVIYTEPRTDGKHGGCSKEDSARQRLVTL